MTNKNKTVKLKIKMTKQRLLASAKTLKTINNNMIDRELSDLCEITETEGTTIIFGDKTYSNPARLGKIIDNIIRASKDIDAEIKILTFGKAELNTQRFLFKRLDEKTVPLTEKESEILTYLHSNKPDTIPKNTLLKSVWEYADSVETHTLETHIYRLRQKIEQDPANPEILLTKENGYTVL